MTIDERLEALTQSVELLTQDVHGLQDTVATLGARDMARSAEIDQILAIVREDSENIRTLARIAEIHERRLSAIEGGQ